MNLDAIRVKVHHFIPNTSDKIKTLTEVNPVNGKFQSFPTLWIFYQTHVVSEGKISNSLDVTTITRIS